MASALIHICVAKKINEKLKLNEKELLLGSIAPDISKQIGESKIKSHFLDNEKTSIPNINKFKEKYNVKTAFDIGYLIHLYTDKYFYDGFLDRLVRNDSVRLLDGVIVNLSNDVICNLIYNDYTNLNVELIDYYHLDLSLFYEDFIKPTSIIEEIPISKLDILIDKMGTIILNSKLNTSYIFNMDIIIDFIEEVSLQIEKDLNILM